MTNWQSIETAPKDRIILLKTKIGIVSAQFFPAVSPPWNDPTGDGGEAACWSAYDDAMQFLVECEHESLQDDSGNILGWMEIPQ